MSILPETLADLRQRKKETVLIDVRTPAEFRAAHVGFARNIPLERLPDAIAAEAMLQSPIYVICQSGGRGKTACQRLSAAGISAVNVEGGTQAWAAAGLPVVRGQRAMSLERQVRIAAGSIVLIGAILALTVHPYFAGICAFIGAGLVFAGVTDTCGMGLLLARMPWNRAAEDSGCRT
jgi:rhodanese-related sulfurtransferase